MLSKQKEEKRKKIYNYKKNLKCGKQIYGICVTNHKDYYEFQIIFLEYHFLID